MSIFIVDVEWSTFDALKAGIVCVGDRRVLVLANDGDEAALIAAQMVACRDVKVTMTTVCV